jgi:DNA adenine methylase
MPLTVLENLYELTNSNLSKSAVKLTETKYYIEAICRCNTNKAPIRFLMSCLLAKIDKQNVDIRKPYTEIKDNDTFYGSITMKNI